MEFKEGELRGTESEICFICSSQSCNIGLARPSWVPWRQPKVFIAEESNCGKYAGSWRTIPRWFSNHSLRNCVREVWQQGRCLCELINCVLHYLWKPYTKHWNWRARIGPSQCFTPGSGHMPWMGKVCDRWWKAFLECLQPSPLTLIFLLNSRSVFCRMPVLVWVI